MGIVSSTYTTDAHTQPDGSRYVYESHVDSAGVTHSLAWLAHAGEDIAAIMAGHADALTTMLAEREFQELLNG